jgi:hypothetical protein
LDSTRRDFAAPPIPFPLRPTHFVRADQLRFTPPLNSEIVPTLRTELEIELQPKDIPILGGALRAAPRLLADELVGSRALCITTLVPSGGLFQKRTSIVDRFARTG